MQEKEGRIVAQSSLNIDTQTQKTSVWSPSMSDGTAVEIVRICPNLNSGRKGMNLRTHKDYCVKYQLSPQLYNRSDIASCLAPRQTLCVQRFMSFLPLFGFEHMMYPLPLIKVHPPPN